MGPFYLLLGGMLFVWLINNGVLEKLLSAITGPVSQTGGIPNFGGGGGGGGGGGAGP